MVCLETSIYVFLVVFEYPIKFPTEVLALEQMAGCMDRSKNIEILIKKLALGHANTSKILSFISHMTQSRRFLNLLERN